MREQWTPERIAEVRAELSDLLNTPEREIEHPAPVQRAAGLGLTLAAALESQQAELNAAREHNSLYERALINIGNLSGDAFGIAEDAQIIAHNALLDVENKVIDATRAEQEES